MSSRGEVEWRDVEDVLQSCCPGFTVTTTGHKRCIRWNDLEYPSFPLGRHGGSRSSGRAEIQIGHVRRLARFFGITDCAAKQIPLIKH